MPFSPTIHYARLTPSLEMDKMQLGKKDKARKLTVLLKGLGLAGGRLPLPPPPKKVSSSSRSSFLPVHLLIQKWVGGADREKDEIGSAVRRCRSRVAPEGCFSVYVGPERKRFVVRTEHANHRLFRELLGEAESEYGFRNDGPIALPCSVDLFHRILGEMDSENEVTPPHGRTFSPRRDAGGSGGSYQVLSTPLFRVR